MFVTFRWIIRRLGSRRRMLGVRMLWPRCGLVGDRLGGDLILLLGEKADAAVIQCWSGWEVSFVCRRYTI